MKQVVISPSENVLNVYWFVQYMKLKGKEAFIYKRIINKKTYDIIKYVKVNEDELDKNNTDFGEWCEYKLSSKDLGVEISFKDIESCDDYIIYNFNCIDDREDNDLIKICKQANNEEMAKIVDILDDVEYEIQDIQCGIGETIVEKHRVWM